ncbi:metallophosphoesterase [Stigmatella aurantiaca]|uniref:HthB protein n=2 Tax=Stigmatella aurantiaca (strain DW4/3-1) TaxID=378806 RepID=E3FC54_STIAD|nr:metallophosphoesterase [Stigmatella aurantiaca]ADO68777.1 HthB protein [Stigmatella aurantiaca DW4/3-1]
MHGSFAPFARRPRVAVGDPQTDIHRFFTLLERRGLLTQDGWLRPDAQLISVGDHFDWGTPHERNAAARSGLHLLAWLAAQPSDQVAIIAGNHDLARVGELVDFTDATFTEAQAEADRIYAGDNTDKAQEQEFLQRYPQVHSVELIARDYSTFREEQRTWVAYLLRERRMRLAYASAPGLLVSHAGVTREDLLALGIAKDRHNNAHAAAYALNDTLDTAVENWKGGPLTVPGLYQPGNRDQGEGLGIVYHRPSVLPEDAERTRQNPRRRFNPLHLPLGLTQVIGHTRDKRARELLGQPPEAQTGGIRHLVTNGQRFTYAAGPPGKTAFEDAVLVFTDGGLNDSPLESIEFFDFDTRGAR